MIRVVVDSNVFVSGLNFGGVPGQVLDMLVAEAFKPCTSPPLIEEVRRVLVERFEWSKRDLTQTLDPLLDFAEVVNPAKTVDVTDDPDDNRVLECAAASRADLIVTGDRDLLRLRAFEGIPIVSPRDLVNRLAKE